MTASRDNRSGAIGGARATRRAWLRILCAAAVLLMLNFKGCNWAGDPAGAGATTALMAHRVNGGTDVTFFVAADTHFGVEGIADLNARQIDAMNALPGTPLPRPLGGTVQEPRGVLIAGDLTDDGSKPQWRNFVEHYGLTGKDARLRFPVYECTGNHDRHAFLFRPVLDGVKRRHGDDRLRIAGTEGIVEVVDEGTRVVLMTPTAVEDVPLPPGRDLLAEFVASVRGEGDCVVTPAESFRITEVALRARGAADAGRVVNL